MPVRADSESKSRPASRWVCAYGLETDLPIFCRRDGIPRRTWAEISYERRNGYSWLGDYARDLLAREAPAWRQRQAAARAVRCRPTATPSSILEHKTS